MGRPGPRDPHLHRWSADELGISDVADLVHARRHVGQAESLIIRSSLVVVFQFRIVTLG